MTWKYSFLFLSLGNRRKQKATKTSLKGKGFPEQKLIEYLSEKIVSKTWKKCQRGTALVESPSRQKKKRKN